MKTLVLQISGMTCDHCAGAITHAITALEGVENVSVDLMSATVHVELDEKLCAAPQLIDAVRRAGYAVNGFTTAD